MIAGAEVKTLRSLLKMVIIVTGSYSTHFLSVEGVRCGVEKYEKINNICFIKYIIF